MTEACRLEPEALAAFTRRLLAAAGTPDDIARVVAASLVDADLKGVESHGVLRIPHYLQLIREGYLQPAGRPAIRHENAAWVLMDGHQGFGHFALQTLCTKVMALAARTGIAFGGLVNTTHTGRIGWFAEQAALEDQAIQIQGGGAHHNPEHASVAPYGGRDRILGTSPLTLGWPGGRFGAVVADFSTSTTAEGKVRFYREQDKALPPDWILDAQGMPSTNPHDLYAGGAILTMGGHKGYGLNLFNEFLGGIMLGPAHELNWSVIVVDIGTFGDIPALQQAAERLLARIKDSQPAPGHGEVLLPGEREYLMARERSRTGIPVASAIWEQIAEAALAYGLTPPQTR